MTREHSLPMRHSLWAKKKRQEGDLVTAGNYYSTAAYGWLLKLRHLPEDIPGEEHGTLLSPKQLGSAIRVLLASSLSYRLAGEIDRCRNRAKLGLLIVDDVLDYEELFQDTEDNPRYGLGHEMKGDLKLVADLDSFESEYEIAARSYREADSQFGWQSEPEFDWIIQPLLEFADSVGHNIDETTREQISVFSLSERIQYKIEHYEDIIDAVIEDGNWESNVL